MLIRIKYYIKCLSSAETILFPVSSIYYLVIGNMRYGKGHTSRTEPVLVQGLCIRLTLTFTPIIFEQGARSVRWILQSEKRLRKGR